MRILFVVQRYGREVNGGAEHHCRMLAERLALRPEVSNVSVFTSCARDYRTWQNHYPTGVERLNGVCVERFPTRVPRLSPLQSTLDVLLRVAPNATPLARSWLFSQGPVVPGLLDRLGEVRKDYDAFVFFTYLYYPTVLGLERLRARRILVPTAHDEPALRIGLFHPVFENPEALAFNSEEERALALSHFRIAPERAKIVGCGVDIPDARMPAAVRHRPYVLYLGRIARNKGVVELVRGFSDFKRRYQHQRFVAQGGTYTGSELELVIAGTGDRELLPKRDDIVLEGFVSDARKEALLANAEVLLMPSRYESLSLVTLEAWTHGTPVLVERVCAVTAGHVTRSGGGRTYHGTEEFSHALAGLLANAERRRELARCGRAYVEQHYAWPLVEDRMLASVRDVAQGVA